MNMQLYKAHQTEAADQAALNLTSVVLKPTGFISCTRCLGKKNLTSEEWAAAGFKGMAKSDCKICDKDGKLKCKGCDGGKTSTCQGCLEKVLYPCELPKDCNIF